MNNDNFQELLNGVSIAIGLQNLYENRIQSAQNDVQSANDSQAKYLLAEINRRFDEQNAILEEQNMIMKRILRKLELK